MIQGRVNSRFEAMVRLVIRGHSGRTREVEAIIDTGYNGFLTLPTTLVEELELTWFGRSEGFLADGTKATFLVHTVFVEWDGHRRYIRAAATGNKPLIGMSLLHRHNLYAEVS